MVFILYNPNVFFRIPKAFVLTFNAGFLTLKFKRLFCRKNSQKRVKTLGLQISDIQIRLRFDMANSINTH